MRPAVAGSSTGKSCMKNDLIGNLLVDTNVLVYAVDASEGRKSADASALLQKLSNTGQASTTSQIMTEFYSATTRQGRGMPPILSTQQAALFVEGFLERYAFVTITQAMTLEAVRAAQTHQMHIYDAQIWATAKLSGIQLVLTEDLPSGASIEGVRYINPFAPSFRLSQIGL